MRMSSHSGGDLEPGRRPAGELLRPGALVADRYRLLRQPEPRRHAQVWAATDVLSGRRAELTVLVDGDAAAHRRFTERARALALIRHPAVIPVADQGTGTLRLRERSGLASYAATAPASGVPLTEVETGDGPLAFARTLDLLAQTARGLDAVHRTGFVHGGIQRSCLIVSRDHRVMIVDFLVGFEARSLPRSVADLGESAICLAPELLRSRGQAPTPRADVYALGVIAFHCLAGGPPFDPDDVESLAAAPWGAQPPELLESLAPDVRWAVATAMQADPHRRFTSAGQFADVLEDLARLAVADDAPTLTLRLPLTPPPAPPVEASGPTPAGGRAEGGAEGRAEGGGGPTRDRHSRGRRPAEAVRGRVRARPNPISRWWQLGLARGARFCPHGREEDPGGGTRRATAIGIVLALGTLTLPGAIGQQGAADRIVLHLARRSGLPDGAAVPARPAAGEAVLQAGPAGAEQVRVPDVTGHPLDTALAILVGRLHLQILLQYRYGAGAAPVATVVDQSLVGAVVPPGTVITLTVLVRPATGPTRVPTLASPSARPGPETAGRLPTSAPPSGPVTSCPVGCPSPSKPTSATAATPTPATLATPSTPATPATPAPSGTATPPPSGTGPPTPSTTTMPTADGPISSGR